ncbi:MAG: LEA type 2 family protein [Spirochaetota bacterium]
MKKVMLAGLAALLMFTGCESLRRIGLSIERPTASVAAVSVSRLDFGEVELTAEVLVDNPNSVGITLTGFSYTLVVEGVEFLSGTQVRGVSLPGFSERTFEFPVTVGFRNVVDTVGAIGERDEASYALDVDLSFEVPVLGTVTVPVRREGTFPIVRPPTVRVADLVLDSLSISGARLSLAVEVGNPNGFDFTLESLSYAFAVNERIWFDGATDRRRTIAANGREDVTASFSLSFAEFGRTVRDLLLGDDALEYSFVAEAAVDPEIDLIPTLTLPFNRSGRIDLRRR